ncbi:hypothetical protein EXM22_17245 [Oceanispirochaeta crateris]|uniref:Uncharacterized protein n=1 Tax=Oceanispirochaeta crateris TaxID=2518645 RepID=A0A5C1QSL4_9SPIO|nr:hypothetical protein [Oceanispirochaeta crateris]QEN09644.1 hypothetical protein EXM22_17245 [Oceanispirochaeta crateris]
MKFDWSEFFSFNEKGINWGGIIATLLIAALVAGLWFLGVPASFFIMIGKILAYGTFAVALFLMFNRKR